MLLAFSGKKQVGKSTAGTYLEVRYGFTQVNFADALKKFARKFGWDGKKDVDGRRLLQDLGSVVRAYDADFWVDTAFRQIEKESKLGAENFVICDVRYLNEIQRVKEEGGTIVRVVGDNEDTTDLHPSETELDNFKGWDFTLRSTRGQFDAYYQQIDDMLRTILEGQTAKSVGNATN